MIFHMGLAKHMNTYFRKSFPFQNSHIFLNMYFSYWAYIYLHFFILRQNSHLRIIKKAIVWMVTWKYLSWIKCLFWMENSLRKYVLLLGVPTFEKILYNLAWWLIFWTIFNEDFKNVNFIIVGHNPSTHNFCPRTG